MSRQNPTDSRDPDGVAGVLIDGIIGAARVLRRHYADHIPPDALADIAEDEDVRWLLTRSGDTS